MGEIMKTYAVSYKYLTYSDAKITAKTKEEAQKILNQVLPEAQVEDVWEIENETNKKAS